MQDPITTTLPSLKQWAQESYQHAFSISKTFDQTKDYELWSNLSSIDEILSGASDDTEDSSPVGYYYAQALAQNNDAVKPVFENLFLTLDWLIRTDDETDRFDANKTQVKQLVHKTKALVDNFLAGTGEYYDQVKAALRMIVAKGIYQNRDKLIEAFDLEIK